MARQRGLNTLQTCRMVLTPIRRTIATVDQNPPVYFHAERLWADYNQENPERWQVVGAPEPVGDVTITITALAPMNTSSSGIQVNFIPFIGSPITGDDTAGDCFRCTAPATCGPDCDEQVCQLLVPRLKWIENFTGSLYFLSLWDIFGDCDPVEEYLKVEVDFLEDDGVVIDRTEDPDFVPYHGWVSHHPTLCGDQEGALSRAVGQWRVDPHDGRLVCYHEAYDYYSQNGLMGLNLPVPDDDNATDGELCHGSVLQQHIEGMAVRMWTSAGCVWA